VRIGIGIALALVVAGAPSAAGADVWDPDVWYVDGLASAVVPLGPAAYQGPGGFGGRLAARVYRGYLEGLVEGAAFSTDGSPTSSDQLAYRLRALVGVRHTRVITERRAVVLRALAGGELAGFDVVGSPSWRPEGHRPGAAIELGAESRSALAWGVLSLSLGVAVSAQWTGDVERDEARYLGVELLAGLAVGF
jgi:hypothetical protein